MNVNAENRRWRMEQAREEGRHTRAEWEAMKARFLYRCVRCLDAGVEITKDHILPVYAEGGHDGIENIQPLCRRCNSAKGPEDVDWRGNFFERLAASAACVDCGHFDGRHSFRYATRYENLVAVYERHEWCAVRSCTCNGFRGA